MLTKAWAWHVVWGTRGAALTLWGGDVGGEVGGHLLHGGFDGALPVGVVGRAEVGSEVGEGEAAGVVDECAQTLRIEGGGDVAGGAALGAVAGDEEEDAGHGFAEFGDLFGVGGTDDCAEETVAGIVAVRGGPLGEAVGDVAIEGFAVGDEVLKVARGGVAGADEGEEAVAGFCGGVDEGTDAVGTEVGVDGEGVGGPRGVVGVRVGFEGGEVGFGVAFGGAADVVAFAVEDDEEAARAGVGEAVAEGGHAFGALVFIKGGLEFDGRDAACEDVDEVVGEGAEGVGATGAGVGKGLLERVGEHGVAGGRCRRRWGCRRAGRRR